MAQLDGLGSAYHGSKALVTGHTGFKGAWLSLWLTRLGCEVVGYALDPPTDPNLFDDAGIADLVTDVRGDVRDPEPLERVLVDQQPDYVFHLAALPIVRTSYDEPVETFRTNIMGTVNLLEAVRRHSTTARVIVVTSDKCYLDRAWHYGYREDDPLGGADPYSASKSAQEIVTASYRRSYFRGPDGVRVASARAGNVMGGGDWAKDRLVPDAIRSLASGVEIEVRNPAATRPWQHVLQPLSGYLLLGARLAGPDGATFADAWNFGPSADTRSVGEITDLVIAAWGGGAWRHAPEPEAPPETGLLALAIERAGSVLRWAPTWDIATTIDRTVGWYLRYQQSKGDPAAVRALCGADIDAFELSAQRCSTRS